MYIWRGPSSKPFYDDSQRMVASVELSEVVPAWHSTVRVKVNITKDGHERRAVAHVEFTKEDALALHQSFMQGLLERSSELAVEFQEVAHGRDAAHGRLAVQSGVWPMPVVAVHEGLQGGFALR